MAKRSLSISLTGVFGLVAILAIPLVARAQDQERLDPDDFGMGPGMMGGMRGSGMDWGMMGGYGGPGMMRSYGMGPIWRLDLSDAQRSKINAIADQLRKKHWEIMGRIMDDWTQLRDLYAASEPDPKAVGKAYADISKLRQGMIEDQVQATNQARALLTKEQRERFDKWRREDWRAGAWYRGMGMGTYRPQ